MPLCWIFLLKRRSALSKVSFSPTRTSANVFDHLLRAPDGACSPRTQAHVAGRRRGPPGGAAGAAGGGRRGGGGCGGARPGGAPALPLPGGGGGGAPPDPAALDSLVDIVDEAAERYGD